MQGAIFAKILQMSVTGSYSIGVVLAVRLLLMRCGRRYAYQLWLLMFVSLCLPFSLPGNYSLIPGAVAEFSLTDGMPEEEPVQDRTGQETDAVDSEDRQEQPVTLHRLSPAGISTGQVRLVPDGTKSAGQDIIQEAEKAKPAGPDRASYLIWAEKIWFLGLLLLLLYDLFAMYRMYRRCSGYGQPEQREGGWIVEAEGVPSPFLWGMFRPVIYLPSGLEGEERIYILAHETVHRNRGDHLVRLWLLAAASVHWFNPFVWLAYALCCRDMEISCDEAVLRSSGTGIRRSYAESLLKYAAGQNRFLISPPGFGEPSVKSRIKNVLHFRKRSVWISLAAGLCVLGVAAGLLHHPAEEEVLPEEPVREAEPLPEGEEPAVDEKEGLIVNNGGSVICVAGEYYYMDGAPLYSDGEALYASVLDDDGMWHVCRYETDGSGFRWLFDGRIVDSTEYGQILYCMFPSESGSGECPGWYDTQAEQTGRFSGDGAAYLGKYEGFLYISRQEADGLHVGRIREIDRTEMPDLMKEGIPAGEPLAFYADEGGKRLVFAVEASEEDSSRILCYSYETETGGLLSKELTGLPYFAMMDGYVYFQRYRSREDHTLELFRTDYEFTKEEQIGEGLTLLRADEETHTLLAEKRAEHPDYGPVDSLVRVLPDEKKEQMLLNMETMLRVDGGEDLNGGDVCLDWEFRKGDRIAYSELNLFGKQIYVTVSHLSGQGEESGASGEVPSENPPEAVHLTISDPGRIGIWFPDELTPGWEDDTWYTEPMVGQPAGMEAEGWDPEHAVDVREHIQELPMEPGASERRNTYLLGETEYWTLYGKGDYRSMLLARNGRYTRISHPYLSGHKISPELMEADLDHDGITELAIRIHIKHGTGCSIDTLLVADFENNGAWVYQFLEEDLREQLMAHITGERTKNGLQAYIDGEPAGAPMEDEEGGRTFQSVNVGQLVDFFFDEAEGKIQVQADLEFWDEDAPGMAGYNNCSITADVVWLEDHFELRNTCCQESEAQT